MTFNALDATIALLFLLAAVRGSVIGLARQSLSLGGFLAGLIAGAIAAPFITPFVPDPLYKFLSIFLILILSAVFLSAVGEKLGMRLAVAAHKYQVAAVDRGLGAVFGGATILTVAWLTAGVLAGSPYLEVNQLVNGSAIVRSLDQRLPPAPPVLARLQKLIEPNGFPRVFTGLEPLPAGPISVATVEEVALAVRNARASVVRIQGSGCGGLVTGSGFMAADGYVMTNAHVVAGIQPPVVDDANGRHRATVVHFDPNKDVAILRTTGLAGPPLAIRTDDVPGGTHVVVLGFPGGGPFRAGSAGVISERFATGRNIYDTGLSAHNVLELQALVQPGNSGGPLGLPDGSVAGLIFARSEASSNVGYALTSSEIIPKLRQAQRSTAVVSSGRCAAE